MHHDVSELHDLLDLLDPHHDARVALALHELAGTLAKTPSRRTARRLSSKPGPSDDVNTPPSPTSLTSIPRARSSSREYWYMLAKFGSPGSSSRRMPSRPAAT
jgi:hypothetical protein